MEICLAERKFRGDPKSAENFVELQCGKIKRSLFIISDITPNSYHFEQVFSDDGGKIREVNWIATDNRIK